MDRVRSLSHLRLRSPDPASWSTFGVDVLGMDAVELPQGFGFRIDEHPHRLVVVAGERGIDGVGFDVGSATALEALSERAARAGFEVSWVNATEAEAIGVSGAARLTDPFGTPVELVHGPRLLPDAPVRRHVSGFVTGELGAGHVVLGGTGVDEALSFYREILGFEVRNTQRRAGSHAGYPQDRIWFLGCNGRHHTVALFERPGPSELVHFMVEVATIDDVGRAHDRALAAGLPQRLTLGRHSNDGMISFYTSTPDDFTVEVGCDGIVVAMGEPEYEATAGSLWGHARVQP